MMHRAGSSLLLAFFFAGAFSANARADVHPILALTPGLAGERLGSFLDDLERQGVNVSVAVSGVGCVVAGDGDAHAVLSADPRVALVQDAPIAVGERFDASRAQGLLEWWNERFEAPPTRTVPEPGENVQICAGATTLEDALRERGGNLRCSASVGGRVHFASGRVVVNLVFPESEGAGSLADWTPALQTTIEAELVRALHWWNLKSGGAVTFVLVGRGSAATTHEPGLLMISDEYLYLGEAMTSLGYAGACAYSQIDAMNEESRAEHRAHWAFTQVVIHANEFPGSGALAYAYLGGPHTVALSGNGGLGTDRLDRVIAHEIGHIFQALDEYAGGCGGCSQRSGYLDVPNRNCVSCIYQTGKCVMRGGGEYNHEEMDRLEENVHACEFTLGMAGIQDANDNGVIDVRETFPETLLFTALPDTMFGTRNFAVQGRAWDLPFVGAPPRYAEPVTINTITSVEFSVDGRKWSSGVPTDGFWTSREEEFELRLPEVGGGTHRLWVRAVNSVGGQDPTPEKVDFFVYDVVLRDPLEAIQDGADMVLVWRVNGSDLSSRFLAYRTEVGAEGAGEVPAIEIASRGRMNDKFIVRDSKVRAGAEYIYRLEVDIPGKGRKALGSARGKTFLANPPPGQFVISSPNPTTGSVLISVTVPRGPRRDNGMPPPGEDNGGVINPPGRSQGGLRDGSDPPPSGGFSPLWRDVSIAVYDVSGRLVKDLGTSRRLELTRFNVVWDGTTDIGARAPTGVYFLQTTVGEMRQSIRITIVR
jgi:hypothetical protein